MKANPSLQKYPEIMSFLNNEYSELKINYFAVGRIFRDGSLYSITSDPAWSTEHLVNNKMPPAHLFENDQIDAKQLSFSSENMIDITTWNESSFRYAQERFKIKNLLVESNKHEHYIDQIFIDLHHPHAMNIILNQKHLIDRLIKSTMFQFRDLLKNLEKNPLKFESSSLINSNKHDYFSVIPKAHVLCHKGHFAKLTNREYVCLALLSKGKLLKEVALELSISRRTVESHIVNIKKKLKILSTSELIACYWFNQDCFLC